MYVHEFVDLSFFQSLIFLPFSLSHLSKSFVLSVVLLFYLSTIVFIHWKHSFAVLLFFLFFKFPPQWDTADAEIKVPSTENQELSKVLSLNPGADKNYTATHASLNAMNFSFLIYLPGPFNFIFSKSSQPLLFPRPGMILCY